MLDSRSRLCGLYGISPVGWVDHPEQAFALLEQAILGGLRIFQFREKRRISVEIEQFARRLQELCRAHGVLFIVNDDLDLALALGADGLHVGAEDLPLSEARARFQGIIGVSCYGDPMRALEAQKRGADYVAFGACFPSATKQEAPVIEWQEIFPKARESLSLPLCAIGGIDVQNVPRLLGACEMVAVISALWSARDVKKRASEFIRAWQGEVGNRGGS